MAVVTPRLVAAMREQMSARERLLSQTGATHVGWKLGMGERESIDGHIVVGHLTSATVFDPGSTYEARPEEDLHVDVEAYVELGAIDGYGVALEIVDLTTLQGEPDSIVQVPVAVGDRVSAVIGDEIAVTLDISNGNRKGAPWSSSR